MPNEAKQSNAKQSNAKQIKAMQSNAKQSKAKQSKANQSNAKQSKAKQHYPSVTVTRSRGGYYYHCPRGSCILMVYEMVAFHKDITPVFPRVGPRTGRPTGALRAAHHQRHGRITTGRLSLPFWFKMCPLVSFLAARLWPHSHGVHFGVFVVATAKQQVRCRTGSTANRSSLSCNTSTILAEALAGSASAVLFFCSTTENRRLSCVSLVE